ncbi:MAG TPA: type I polyketide synthase, partial [Methylomirabilota bacterium]|nr:type I polyketide synthase [Methylomirabilota bacterium]
MTTERREAIAIIGMAGRFPGAGDVETFWRNLCAGVESIRPFTAEEMRASGVDPGLLADPSYVNAGAPLEGAECFDAAFFGYHPREAELLDPQHRLFLECAWSALEDAGHDPATFDGAIGVFGGVGRNLYLRNNLLPRRGLLDAVGPYPEALASEKDYAATRVSFKLDLRGPSVNVNTACSTSGVAAHIACQSLLGGECDMALVGGARIRVPMRVGYRYEEGGILSPDGHCRAFDADAQGTVVGNGVAFVVLRRLSDALRDGDRIVAVILGSAINNDGASKAGFTTPSVRGQAAAIAEALAVAGVAADTIGYIEAHGTGTAVGDPIEVAALTKAFRRSTDRNGFCAIGSVKTNIGHLDAAAGLAGLIKAALAIERGVLPPSLHYRRPNPQIDFERSPFFVNAGLREWPRGSGPRRAGVSSFGLGGTNSHLVLEQAPPPVETSPARPHQLIVVSARTPESLDGITAALAAHFRSHPETDLADAAYTLQVGRRPFEHRRFTVCGSTEEAAAAL